MPFLREYKDCYVVMDSKTLKIGNDTMERVWDIESDIPSVVSLRNKLTGKEWISHNHSAFSKTGIIHGARKLLGIDVILDNDCGVAEAYLQVEVTLEYTAVTIRWIHVIYHDKPIIRTFLRCELKDKLASSEYTEEGNVIYEDLETARKPNSDQVDDYLDYIPIQARHGKWKLVRFNDATDYHNNLVKTDEGLFYSRESNKLEGNLLFINDLIENDGITLIKEGPTPNAYQGGMKNDFYMNGNKVYICGWGITNEDLNKHKSLDTYGSTVILWSGMEEQALISVQDYHRAVHRYVPDKDAFVMSNTWGDRSQDGKISEAFVLQELEAAEQLGVSLYQIDDGWQRGVTVTSLVAGGVSEGYYSKDPNFWSLDDARFPRGLKLVTESAMEKGIMLGLWFVPDATDDFVNWERDAGVLLGLYKEHGARSFKLDGIKIRSKKGEEHVYKMMRAVVEGSDGQAFFNLDVTAGARTGYYGRVQYACIFLENRYTDWQNYYPHWTLRNLWMLSRYYPTYRLQMEFLNVKRNSETYGNDVLSPSSCGIEYAFATTMLANPLAWMELTGLDADSMNRLQQVIKTYRVYQAELLAGCILPIGEEPSGTGWTGFQSMNGENQGFIIMIREYNDRQEYKCKLWQINNKRLKLERILGSGMDRVVDVDQEGYCRFELADKLTYVLYKYALYE